ncbi:DUF1003 domain-containing protein [Luethyella okanaganae]|uniref:DUF1003 domain-containing protein n=1 Tax=Luethyella okanaganae TaxID=69372 RepID=A0ABW1VF98_9MICO
MSMTSARRVPTRTWHEEQRDRLTRGQRAADRMRNFMGSWGFVAGFLIFMVLWAIANASDHSWDPYPFILLNLFLSMMAGLQGAILLIAARRQDAIAATLAQHDFETNKAAKADIETVLEINRQQLTTINELRDVLQRMVEKDQDGS